MRGVWWPIDLISVLLGPDLAWLLRWRAAFVECAQLSTRVCAGFVVAALLGELDIVDADNVAAELTVLTARGGCLIVDMSALCFIDCGALGALVRVEQHARRSGAEVVLAAPQYAVARTLALTGIGEAFRVYGSVQDAVAANADGRFLSRCDVVDDTGEQPRKMFGRRDNARRRLAARSSPRRA